MGFRFRPYGLRAHTVAVLWRPGHPWHRGGWLFPWHGPVSHLLVSIATARQNDGIVDGRQSGFRHHRRPALGVHHGALRWWLWSRRLAMAVHHRGGASDRPGLPHPVLLERPRRRCALAKRFGKG